MRRGAIVMLPNGVPSGDLKKEIHFSLEYHSPENKLQVSKQIGLINIVILLKKLYLSYTKLELKTRYHDISTEMFDMC